MVIILTTIWGGGWDVGTGEGGGGICVILKTYLFEKRNKAFFLLPPSPLTEVEIS